MEAKTAEKTSQINEKMHRKNTMKPNSLRPNGENKTIARSAAAKPKEQRTKLR
jgi:hypothetical protein